MHEPRSADLVIDDSSFNRGFVESICAGDKIKIYAVSAPYPGYECRVEAGATLAIVIQPTHWERRKYAMMFLYYAGFHFLGGTISEKECPITCTNRVFVNMDLCRVIVSYL